MKIFSHVIKSYRAFATAELLKETKAALVVLSRDQDIYQFKSQLKRLLKREILSFYSWDCLPYDRISPSLDCISQRAQTLTALAENTEQIVVTSVAAISQYLPPRLSFLGEALTLKKKQAFSFSKLQSYLIEKGFNRVSVVYEPGDYAVRGDIIDFFPVGDRNPYRIDFFWKRH